MVYTHMRGFVTYSSPISMLALSVPQPCSKEPKPRRRTPKRARKSVVELFEGDYEERRRFGVAEIFNTLGFVASGHVLCMGSDGCGTRAWERRERRRAWGGCEHGCSVLGLWCSWVIHYKHIALLMAG